MRHVSWLEGPLLKKDNLLYVKYGAKTRTFRAIFKLKIKKSPSFLFSNPRTLNMFYFVLGLMILFQVIESYAVVCMKRNKYILMLVFFQSVVAIGSVLPWYEWRPSDGLWSHFNKTCTQMAHITYWMNRLSFGPLIVGSFHGPMMVHWMTEWTNCPNLLSGTFNTVEALWGFLFGPLIGCSFHGPMMVQWMTEWTDCSNISS